VRLAVRDTRQAIWELAAPGGRVPRQAIGTGAAWNFD